MSPERWVDEPPGVPSEFPTGRGWAGDGPAEGGPLLFGVMISLVSSSSVRLELAMLLWLPVISIGLWPPTYICAPGPDVDESMVLVRLPLLADRDMVGVNERVSVDGLYCNISSIVGDVGGIGKGLLRSVELLDLTCPKGRL